MTKYVGVRPMACCLEDPTLESVSTLSDRNLRSNLCNRDESTIIVKNAWKQDVARKAQPHADVGRYIFVADDCVFAVNMLIFHKLMW